ncbi:MAG: hypothetical protein KFF68_04525, partial [Desulfosarcina sp.]|nr:hypothetical protein [Desulfosarcina sp.]
FFTIRPIGILCEHFFSAYDAFIFSSDAFSFSVSFFGSDVAAFVTRNTFLRWSGFFSKYFAMANSFLPQKARPP